LLSRSVAFSPLQQNRYTARQRREEQPCRRGVVVASSQSVNRRQVMSSQRRCTIRYALVVGAWPSGLYLQVQSAIARYIRKVMHLYYVTKHSLLTVYTSEDKARPTISLSSDILSTAMSISETGGAQKHILNRVCSK